MLELHIALLPPLPPLCRPHENLVALDDWNLHGENGMQFLLLSSLPLLRSCPNLLYRRHQIADQCARVHSHYLNLDSYHGTRFFVAPPSPRLLWRRPPRQLPRRAALATAGKMPPLLSASASPPLPNFIFGPPPPSIFARHSPHFSRHKPLL